MGNANKPITLSELIKHVGDEHIIWQRLDESILNAQQRKHHVAVTFATDQLTMNEVATGQYRKRALVIWLPVERLPG
jgi:hypothetical protein